MSKKTQKKTLKKPPKTAPRKAPRAASKTSTAKPAAKNKAAKAGKPAASKRPTTKASHQGASKALKAQRPKAAAKPKANPTPNLKPNPKPNPRADSKAGLAQPTAPRTETTAAANPPRAALVAARAGLAEGTKAPAFHLPRDGGTTVSLSDFAGQKLVLFFYPRADTPGCTKEAIDFTRLSAAFAESKTAVLGVSADPPKAQEAFRNKHQLSVPLASDEQHAMLEAYGVWGEKSMYGRTFLGISRTTVLIGADSRVLRIWRNVKVDGHADEVLAEAQRA